MTASYIGKILLHWMVDQDMNRSEFAKLVGCSGAFVTLVIQGERLPPQKWKLVLPNEVRISLIENEITAYELKISDLKHQL